MTSEVSQVPVHSSLTGLESLETCGPRKVLGESLLFAYDANPPGARAQVLEFSPSIPSAWDHLLPCLWG